MRYPFGHWFVASRLSTMLFGMMALLSHIPSCSTPDRAEDNGWTTNPQVGTPDTGGAPDDPNDSSGWIGGNPQTDGLNGGDSTPAQDIVDPLDMVLTSCVTDGDCPPDMAICLPSGTCGQCTSSTDCKSGEMCKSGLCQPKLCEPNSETCNANAVQSCNADGTGFDLFDCSPGTCQSGKCTGCIPGTKTCKDGDAVQCTEDGSEYQVIEDCAELAQCFDGQCLLCYPGTGKCEGKDGYKCKGDGSGWEFVATCSAGQACIAGKCQSLCSGDIKFNTNVGCDYWAVDLDNASGSADVPGADNAQYAIVVSNTSTSDAEVTIRKEDAGAPQATAWVPAGGLHIFNLPPHNVNGSMKAARAWRVAATAPIVAYQFNPLENVGVFSNDASVLFPSNTWGTEYLVMTRRQTDVSYRGYLTVVAGFSDTEVTVTVSAPTKAGVGVPALKTGESYKTTLQPYEVLSIESDSPVADLTGSSVTSSKPVGVFGGHEAAITGTQCCADHLEEQMIPVSAWGKTYVASRSHNRGVEPDYWRILASEDNTTVITNPPQTPIPPLKKGQYYELKSTADFQIDATKPILVGQYLASSFEINGDCQTGCKNGSVCEPIQNMCFMPNICTNTAPGSCPAGHICAVANQSCEPIGDPAFILAAPVEQFRNEYLFLVPNKYYLDYLNVIAPVGATIILDNGTPISLTQINSQWAAARLPIADGVHTIQSTAGEKFGIVVYGFDDDVSYGYPGGMALEKLNK